MFPIGDDNTGRRSRPYVTWALIALNILVFVLLQGFGSNERFTYSMSTVPQEIVTGDDVVTDDREVAHPVTGEKFIVPGLQVTPLSVYLTLLTSMFMHGGLAHLFGNLLFLLIFGDNVEDDMGRVRFPVFYLLTGLVGSLAHVFTTAALGGDMFIPSLGASGAISGVLGGYLVLHPKRKVRVIIMRTVQQVPAIVAIGLWFVFQIISSLGFLGGGSQAGGVAYAAHVGGFIAGLALAKLFAREGGGGVAPELPRATFR